MGKRKWQVKRKNGKEKEEIMWKRKTEKKRERERGLRGGLQFSRFTFFSITGARVPLYSR